MIATPKSESAEAFRRIAYAIASSVSVIAYKKKEMGGGR